MPDEISQTRAAARDFLKVTTPAFFIAPKLPDSLSKLNYFAVKTTEGYFLESKQILYVKNFQSNLIQTHIYAQNALNEIHCELGTGFLCVPELA